MKANCEECIGFDDAMELPPPTRTITNHRIEGILEIERAFSEDAHDFVSSLPLEKPKPRSPEPKGMHGAIFGDLRYCVPCDGEFDLTHNPQRCPSCGAPWDRPVTDEAA